MNRRSPMVSVIIPCYNQGKYIEKTLQSVFSSTFKNYEIIIVNDGSTDTQTNELLRNLKMDGLEVILNENQGLAEARNTGIRYSHGKYILPLDADDKISSGYLKDAAEILENNPNIKIVSCEVRFFGKKFGLYNLPDYSIEKLLGQNTLVVSSFFRRNDFDKTVGYNPNMIYGFEDWDFWLSLLGQGGDVYRIPRVHFYYRIKRRSRNADFAKKTKQLREMRYQIYQNHKELYSKYFFDPTKSFEYYLIQNSMEYKVGKTILKPVRYFFNLLT